MAIAQIDYQPAYLGRSVSYLKEPSIIEEAENGLSALVQFPRISDTRTHIRDTWIEHMKRKVERILYFCATHRVDLVVFPEYSIPIEVLPECKDSADNRRMIIVAGSHTVAGGTEACQAYERVGIAGLNLQPADPNSDIRKAVCPIFIPGSKTEIIEKMSKSVWESDMTAGRAASCLSVNIRGTALRLGILLCIDALRLEHLAALYSGESQPDLLIVPSLSRSTAPFESLSQLGMINEMPSVYVNISEPGGSRITAKPGTATPNWPLEGDGTEKMPESAEAVIVAEIDFDEQVDVRKTVRPHLGMRVVSYAPLLYASHSSLCRDFVNLRTQCFDPRNSGIPREVQQQLTMLTRTEGVLFPNLLKSKIRRLIDSLQSGSLRAEDIKFFLATVDVPAGVCSTLVLRQLLIQDALNAVVGLMESPESVREEEKIFKVMKNVAKHRIELPGALGSECRNIISSLAATDKKPKERDPEGDTSHFADRQSEINQIRAFVNSGDHRAFLVTGFKGIGKTALIRRVFVEVLPKWRCIWVQIVEGVAFEQLMAECATKLDIPVTGIPGREDARELAQLILARIDSVEATSLVLDDCDNLLGPAGEIFDEDTKRFIIDLASRPSRRNAKVFLISNASLPLTQAAQAITARRQLHGLDARDGRNLLEYWIRLQREELRGQPIEIPDKLVSFLQGHPLATKIAARLCTTYTPDQLIGDLSIFKKLRQAIVEVLLDRIVLTNSQKALLEFASVFRSGVSIELFRRWGGDAALLELESMLAKFLLDVVWGEYWMHPAIGQYFYEQVEPAKVRSYHRLAGDYYLREHGRRSPKDASLIVEAVHHIAAAGDIEQARSLGIHKEQLRVIAKSAYARKDRDASLTYYEAISQIDAKDLEALARMALLLGRAARWGDADRHFESATKIKDAQWVYQAYGAIKTNAGLLTEAEQLLHHALELNDRDSATLASLAALRLRQRRDYEAEKLFREALESNPENPFALSHYARFLINNGRRAEAKPYAELLVELEPRNPYARELLKESAELETRMNIPAANDTHSNN